MAIDKVSVVLRGYTKLSAEEQAQFILQINEYIKAQDKQLLCEGIQKRANFSIGPVNSSGCPCCGR